MTITYIGLRPSCEFLGYPKKEMVLEHVVTKVRGKQHVPMYEGVLVEEVTININRRNQKQFHLLFTGEFDDILL